MEVAYREMSEARYRTLHRRVARRMRTFTGSVSTASPVYWPSILPVADVANRLPNSLFGGRTARVAAWSEALAFYEQAISAITDDREHIAVLIALGNVYFEMGDIARDEQTCARRLTLRAPLGIAAALTGQP